MVIEVNLLLTQEREEFIGINALYILLELFTEGIEGFFCLIDFYSFFVGNRKLRRKCSDKLFNRVHSFKLSHSFNALSQFSFELFVELRLFVFSESVKEAFCVLNVALVGIFELFGCGQSLYELFNCSGASHNGDCINMRNNFQCIVARHGRPCRIAAGNIDYIALFYGDGFTAGIIIIGRRSVLVKIGSYLERFVVCGVVKGYGVLALVHGEKIARGFLIEGGSKSSVGGGKCFQ